MASGGPLFCSAQVLPIDIGSQGFANDSAFRFALDCDSQGFADVLADTDRLPEIPERCAASVAEVRLLFCPEAVEVCAQSFHERILLPSNVLRNTIWSFTER